MFLYYYCIAYVLVFRMFLYYYCIAYVLVCRMFLYYYCIAYVLVCRMFLYYYIRYSLCRSCIEYTAKIFLAWVYNTAKVS